LINKTQTNFVWDELICFYPYKLTLYLYLIGINQFSMSYNLIKVKCSVVIWQDTKTTIVIGWYCKTVELFFTISAYSIFSIYFVKHNVHLIKKNSNINHVREDSFLTKGIFAKEICLKIYL
jgi:hypothetical protein